MSATLPIEAQALTPADALALALDLLGWARANGAGEPATVALAFPLTIKAGSGTTRIDEVRVRRPKVADAQAVMGMSEEAAGYALAKRLSGLSSAEFEALDMVDAEAIGEVITGFRRRSPATGLTVG